LKKLQVYNLQKHASSKLFHEKNHEYKKILPKQLKLFETKKPGSKIMTSQTANNKVMTSLVGVELLGASGSQGNFFVGRHGDVGGYVGVGGRWGHRRRFRLLGRRLRGDDVIVVLLFEILYLRSSVRLGGYRVAFIWLFTVYVLILLVIRHLGPALSAAVVEATEAATAAAATRYQAAEYSQELSKW